MVVKVSQCKKRKMKSLGNFTLQCRESRWQDGPTHVQDQPKCTQDRSWWQSLVLFLSHSHWANFDTREKFTTVQFCVTSCNTEPASASAGFTEEAILSQLAFRGCQDGPTYVPPGQSWTRAKMVEGKRNWKDTEDVPTNSKLKAMNNSHQKINGKLIQGCLRWDVTNTALVVVQKQGFC